MYYLKRAPYEIFLVTIVCLVLSACTSRTKFVDPGDVVIQEPLPGEALVYLIRAPHDQNEILVSLSQSAITLPPETYAPVSLKPGTHVMRTFLGKKLTEASRTAPDVELSLEAGKKYFMVIAGRSDRPSTGVQILNSALAGPTVWFIPAGTSVVVGSHIWKPYNEFDARPLISIATLAPREI